MNEGNFETGENYAASTSLENLDITGAFNIDTFNKTIGTLFAIQAAPEFMLTMKLEVSSKYGLVLQEIQNEINAAWNQQNLEANQKRLGQFYLDFNTMIKTVNDFMKEFTEPQKNKDFHNQYENRSKLFYLKKQAQAAIANFEKSLLNSPERLVARVNDFISALYNNYGTVLLLTFSLTLVGGVLGSVPLVIAGFVISLILSDLVIKTERALPSPMINAYGFFHKSDKPLPNYLKSLDVYFKEHSPLENAAHELNIVLSDKVGNMEVIHPMHKLKAEADVELQRYSPAQ